MKKCPMDTIMKVYWHLKATKSELAHELMLAVEELTKPLCADCERNEGTE